MTTMAIQRIHKNRNSYSRVSYYISLSLWCSLLSILLIPPLATAQYNNIDSPECASTDTMYCRPRLNDQFNWTDPITFVWRSSAQPFVSQQGPVDVNLWRVSDQKLCGKWTGITFSDGRTVRTADPTCFDRVVDSTAPVNSSSWQFAFKIVNSGDNTTSLSGSGPDFYIYKYDTSPKTSAAPAASPSTAVVTFTASPTPGASTGDLQNTSKSKTLTPLLIAVVSGAIVAVLVAIVAIVAATRARKRSRKHQSFSGVSTSSNTPMMLHSGHFLGKGHKGDHDNPIEASSIHSTTPLAKQSSVSSLSQNISVIGITQTTTTTSVKSSQAPTISFSDSISGVPITTSDAAMISDAFRQTLRKPDWHEEDEEDTEVGLSSDELRRRREAKELMKKELAEEGRGLQNVQRRQTKMLVHKVDEEDDETATNNSTHGPSSSITSIISSGRSQGSPEIV